jgi:hypothetical protein
VFDLIQDNAEDMYDKNLVNMTGSDVHDFLSTHSQVSISPTCLHAALMDADPKSTKRQESQNYLFAHSGSNSCL